MSVSHLRLLLQRQHIFHDTDNLCRESLWPTPWFRIGLTINSLVPTFQLKNMNTFIICLICFFFLPSVSINNYTKSSMMGAGYHRYLYEWNTLCLKISQYFILGFGKLIFDKHWLFGYFLFPVLFRGFWKTLWGGGGVSDGLK